MTRRRDAWITVAIIATVFSIDRVTKFFFLTHVLATSSRVIAITAHQNYGLMANLPVPAWIIIPITILVLAWIGWKLIDEMQRQTFYPLALIAGGAIGNLYDRLTMGFVFDWIWVLQRSVINLADIAIGVGILWYMLLIKKTSLRAEL